jgi:hypothetical protein
MREREVIPTLIGKEEVPADEPAADKLNVEEDPNMEGTRNHKKRRYNY